MVDANRWQWIKDELEQLKKQSQYRFLVESSSEADGWITRNGRRMLNLASNNYLGLHQPLSPGMLELFARQAGQWGDGVKLGAFASRLVTGNDPVYTAFERGFAAYHGTEGCLVFGSGYMANIGILSSLAGRNDLIFSDRLNHASIVDGILLSRAEHIRYRNRDMDHLESLLEKADRHKKKLIVTDMIFSMDGSLAPLHRLVDLKNRYGAILVVDEAHSGGVYGEQGEGLAHSLGLTHEVDIHMGTFSKAYGCYGAYAAGDSLPMEYLMNKARSFIFTTALPPVMIQAVWHNWLKVRDDGWRRTDLHKSSQFFREELRKRGFNTGDSESQIIPLIVGDNGRTVQFGEALQQRGIAAVAIRPPTVPEGAARVRFSLMASHQQKDLEWALGTVEEVGKQLSII